MNNKKMEIMGLSHLADIFILLQYTAT